MQCNAGLGRALRRAAATGNAAELRRLLKQGGVSAEAACSQADAGGNTAWHYAAAAGHVAALQALMLWSSGPGNGRGSSCGLSVLDAANKAGATPLMVAAASEAGAGAVQSLLAAGATHSLWDTRGRTALHAAAAAGAVGAVAALLEAGADAAGATTAELQQPLHLAAGGGHASVVELLLRVHSVDPQAVDAAGDTALHALAQRWEPQRAADYLDAARTLLAAGCDPSTPNFSGRTPLLLAAERGAVALEQLLESAAGPVGRVLGEEDEDESLSLISSLGSEAGSDGDPEEEGLPLSSGGGVGLHSKSGNVGLGCAAGRVGATGDWCEGLSCAGSSPGELAIVQLCMPARARTLLLALFAATAEVGRDLRAAAATGDADAVWSMLLGHGAQLANLADSDGTTALHVAAAHNHLPVIQVLLEEGAAVDPRNSEGATPVSTAGQRFGWRVGDTRCGASTLCGYLRSQTSRTLCYVTVHVATGGIAVSRCCPGQLR